MDRRRDGIVRGVNGGRQDGFVRGENGSKAGWDCLACEWIEGGMGLSGVRMDRRRDGIVRRVNGSKAGWDCPG